jgi:DNA-binding transcriptional LysR family regulator
VFRIAASDYATITLLPALMRALGSEAPRVSIELLPTGPNILQQLELGKLDLSFWGAAPPPAFAGYTRLFHEHYVGVARAGHPIFASDIVTIEDYLRFAHATVSMQTPGANVIDAALATQGFVRRIGLTSPGFIASLAVLPQTDLIASLPARLCEAPSSGLRHFDLPLDVQPYPYGILWHPRTDQLASHIWLRRVICRVLQEKN